MKPSGDAFSHARRQVLDAMVIHAHDEGRGRDADSLLAKEFRRLAEHMSSLQRKGTPVQLAAFFGVVVGSRTNGTK